MLCRTRGYHYVLAVAAAWGCRASDGQDTTRVPCPPGASQSCIGSNGCIGTRVCGDTGESLSECDCGEHPPEPVASGGEDGDTADDGAAAAPGESPPAVSGPPMLGAPANPSCTPGSQRSCAGEGDCVGVQVCDALGVTFSRCECDLAMPVGRVGARCGADMDCGAGLTCELPSSLNGAFATGGPQGGYCTAVCETTAECRALDPLSACYAQGGVGPGPGYCLKTCSLEPGSSGASCEGRSELACAAPATDDPSFCYPVCDSDADCGDRYCNLFSGLCSPFPPEGQAAIGAGCSANHECASGWCINIAGQRRACSGICIYNGVGGCGFPAHAPERGAACLNPRTPGLPSELLTLGWCSQLCDEDGDCALSTSGWFCERWPADAAAKLTAKWGKRGACIQPSQGACADDCEFAFDGYCDDGGPDSATGACPLASDCADCGPR